MSIAIEAEAEDLARRALPWPVAMFRERLAAAARAMLGQVADIHRRDLVTQLESFQESRRGWVANVAAAQQRVAELEGAAKEGRDAREALRDALDAASRDRAQLRAMLPWPASETVGSFTWRTGMDPRAYLEASVVLPAHSVDEALVAQARRLESERADAA